tara:strand:+ start:201 stop:341 length:141 start_codon:yes stop_codon:yes gene_type:complete
MSEILGSKILTRQGSENQTSVWLTKIADKIPKAFGLASFVVTLGWP